eukprot:13059318-Alexandrium_andersonii.AAC.1
MHVVVVRLASAEVIATSQRFVILPYACMESNGGAARWRGQAHSTEAHRNLGPLLEKASSSVERCRDGPK